LQWVETETASIYEAFFSAFFAPAFAFVSISFDTHPPFNRLHGRLCLYYKYFQKEKQWL